MRLWGYGSSKFVLQTPEGTHVTYIKESEDTYTLLIDNPAMSVKFHKIDMPDLDWFAGLFMGLGLSR